MSKGTFSWLVLVTGLFLFACMRDAKSDRLPFYGHYDVLSADFEGHKKGDTIFHTVPDFSYITQDSIEIHSEQLKDKIWIAKFFFSRCPTICPPMTSSMKQLREDLSDINDLVTYLSFSIDPKKDTPERLREYIQEHGIDADNWYFLTNDDEEATHFLGTEGFKIHAMSDDYAPGGYAHSPNFILVDRSQRIRGIYDGLEKSQVEQLKSDIIKLLKDEYGITR
jgi:protein SCO1